MNIDELVRKEKLHLYDTLKSVPAHIFPLIPSVKCHPNTHKDSMFYACVHTERRKDCLAKAGE
jgi:hypothetical protein